MLNLRLITKLSITIAKMKRLLLMMAVMLGVLAGHAAVKVDRIEPTNWYVGMKDPSVQLMVYGEGIRDAEVAIDYAGVTIDSLVRLDSPNYLLIYLNTHDAQPGTMEMTFKQGRSKKKVKYELLAREKSGEQRKGFTNADVLYMLMPLIFRGVATTHDGYGSLGCIH